ncbi:MAG: NAD(P)/FAD-dependent oxidoreductase [Burkholderiales bacterium]|nr:NAD(P)/FAD-dependent oxidoreductase [Burkholderiales bacterium]
MTRAPVESSVVIVGAGPAGLAVAACLQAARVPHVIVEQAGEVGTAWRHHYHRLHLHTDKAHSGLPYRDFPKSYPRYPSRQQVVDYLDDYAQHFQIKPFLNQTVKKARHVGSQWEVQSQDTLYRAPTMVVAAGYNREPQRPSWPGQDAYGGQILHSAQYANGAPFKGQRVLVVGLGNSGGEIALDLWEHGVQPSVAVRSPVNVIPREFFGVPFLTMAIQQRRWPPRLADAINAPVTRALIGDLTRYGLRKPAQGPVTQIHSTGRIPFIDVGTIGLIKQGHLQVRPGIERFTRDGVVFTDGREERFDAVVLATGYRPNVGAWLEDGGQALGTNGAPLGSGQSTSLPGLYFCGYYISPTGMLREIAQEARQLAQLISERQRAAVQAGRLCRCPTGRLAGRP